MEKQKIAFFVPSFPATTETFVVNQIVDLIKRGHEVHIFALSRSTAQVIHSSILENNLLDITSFLEENSTSYIKRYSSFIRFIGLNRRNVDFGRLVRLFNPSKKFRKIFNLRYFTKYEWIFKEGNFDILHAHFGRAGTFVAELKSFGYYSRAPFIASFHGYDISPHLLEEYKVEYQTLFHEADLFTVNSPYTENLLKGLTEKETVVLPVGLDTEVFKKSCNNFASRKNILFVGRLVPFKAPGLAIKIFEEVHRRSREKVHLNIIGEGELRRELADYVKSKNLEGQVKFLGSQPQERIVEIMDESHIFLLPGIYDEDGRAENQGLVLQEAQAMELPVITSDVGGMKYGLIDEKTGYVIKEGDIDRFVEKIEDLLNDEQKRVEMGKRAREFVKRKYDSTILGRQLEQFYLKLLQKKADKNSYR